MTVANEPLWKLSVHEAHTLLARREVSSVELTREVIDRVNAVGSKTNAYITRTPEIALQQAEEADKRLAAGETNTPLLGVPVGIKDVISTRGVRTTCGSKILENFTPIYNATVVDKLRAAGAVMVGKANCDEFAMGSSNEYSAFGPVHNPWDLERVPGGSSGGSAALVAAGEALCSLGTDTGGSIRLPASFCGVAGLRPTYGRVSRFGLVAFASSLDQIGPFGTNVTDIALTMNVIAGYDPCDSTSVDVPVPDYTKSLIPEVKGLRLGVPKEYFVQGMDPDVERTIRAAIAKLEEMGAIVGETSLPYTDYALAVYYIIAPAEASANLSRYNGVKYGFSVQDSGGASASIDAMSRTRELGFGPEVKRRIMLGTYALRSGYYDAYYRKAQQVRTLIKQDFDHAFEQFDALLAPVCPTVAFKIGEKQDDPLAMYLTDVCTLPVNIAGLNGLSVPCGFAHNLPVGLQIIGRAFDEPTVLRIGYAYEQATGWHKQRPQL